MIGLGPAPDPPPASRLGLESKLEIIHLLSDNHGRLRWAHRRTPSRRIVSVSLSIRPCIALTLLSVMEGGETVSKNELKKRAKQLEKEKKAAEKAARQAELAKQREAADVVRPISIDHRVFADSSGRTMLSSFTANYL